MKCQLTNAQITPIETIVDSKKTTYKTSNHDAKKALVDNQSYALNLKLNRNIKISSDSSISFIKTCLTQSLYNSIDHKKSIFFIEYVVNHQGTTLSASLINYGAKITLTQSQVECILNGAMNNTHEFSSVPSDISSFNMVVRKRYKH